MLIYGIKLKPPAKDKAKDVNIQISHPFILRIVAGTEKFNVNF